MRCGNDHSTILSHSRALLFGIFYLVICIICILVLAQRIRLRQRRKYMMLGAQMDPPSEKSGGEQESGAINTEISYTVHTPYDCAPLPSACDILQPLSHSSQLPSSGYLVAILGQERRNRVGKSYQEEHRSAQPTGSPRPGSEDSPFLVLQKDYSHRTSPSGTEGSPTQTINSSLSASPPTSRGAERDDPGLPSSMDSGEIQSIQRRGHRVQFMHDIDEEGIRTWRRWVIEYS